MTNKKEKKPHFGDVTLWEKVKESVKPLRHKQASQFSPLSQSLPIWEKNRDIAPLPLNAFGEKSKTFLKEREKQLSAGDLTALDGRRAERLRKGKIPIDGSLDLHGFTADAAWKALRNFIFFSYKNKRRCVIIVTGKGWKSASGIGVLRAQLPQWLNMPEIQPMILGFSRAQDKDGGDGAFYVMLKKNKG